MLAIKIPYIHFTPYFNIQIGVWELVDSENRDEWLAFTGAGYMQRSIALRMTWRNEIRTKDGNYYFARVFISGTGPVKRSVIQIEIISMK